MRLDSLFLKWEPNKEFCFAAVTQHRLGNSGHGKKVRKNRMNRKEKKIVVAETYVIYVFNPSKSTKQCNKSFLKLIRVQKSHRTKDQYIQTISFLCINNKHKDIEISSMLAFTIASNKTKYLNHRHHRHRTCVSPLREYSLGWLKNLNQLRDLSSRTGAHSIGKMPLLHALTCKINSITVNSQWKIYIYNCSKHFVERHWL